eukprot:TRINITY_DN3379_c0_g6_i1.p1 TRINITY_DN3379_c0_g6~~TRINITY_DN3379_c0_g6_i1.p1  ORF type:complete len:494 (+),score=95.76 TRINITY_DN3379_c0_g6_i1:66-1547(+)
MQGGMGGGSFNLPGGCCGGGCGGCSGCSGCGYGMDMSGGCGYGGCSGCGGCGGCGGYPCSGGKGGGKAGPVLPGCTVFVFHIPNNWDEAMLERHFRHCGRMSSCVLQRKPDGETRGFGFISFADKESARKAIVGLNGFAAGGAKFLTVQPKKGEEGDALPSGPWPAKGRLDEIVSTSSKGNPAPPGATIFIFHLPNDWSEEELHRHFIHFGAMLTVTVMRDKATGASRGFGFVSYQHPDSARRAIEGMHGFSTYAGKFLKVTYKQGEGDMGGMGGMGGMGMTQDAAAAWASQPVQNVGAMQQQHGGYTAEHSLAAEPEVVMLKAMMETSFQEILSKASEKGVSQEQLDKHLTGIAIQAMNSVKQVLGMPVSGGFGEGIPPPPREPYPGVGGGVAPGASKETLAKIPPGANVYIYGIPVSWDEDALSLNFTAFGSILSARVVRHPDGSSKGFGFVGFESAEAAAAAIAQMNNTVVEGRSLVVQVKEDKPRSKPY